MKDVRLYAYRRRIFVVRASRSTGRIPLSPSAKSIKSASESRSRSTNQKLAALRCIYGVVRVVRALPARCALCSFIDSHITLSLPSIIRCSRPPFQFMHIYWLIPCSMNSVNQPRIIRSLSTRIFYRPVRWVFWTCVISCEYLL